MLRVHVTFEYSPNMNKPFSSVMSLSLIVQHLRPIPCVKVTVALQHPQTVLEADRPQGEEQQQVMHP